MIKGCILGLEIVQKQKSFLLYLILWYNGIVENCKWQKTEDSQFTNAWRITNENVRIKEECF